jgi:hypothetical protein
MVSSSGEKLLPHQWHLPWASRFFHQRLRRSYRDLSRSRLISSSVTSMIKSVMV